MTEVEGLSVTDTAGVLRVCLQRPERRNAMTGAMMAACIDALEGASVDDRVRVIVIEAEGAHFCSGVDFDRLERGGTNHVVRLTARHHGIDRLAHRLVELVAKIEVPVIAAVRGHAAGLGCGMALACDFLIVGESAKFSAPYVRRGFTPDAGTSFLIPRLVGFARAKEMLLTGRVVEAAEAERWGLVAGVVPDAQVDGNLEARVSELTSAATTALGLTKWLLWHNAASTFGDSLGRESLLQDIATRTSDFREGVRSFREKRPPEFDGT